MKAVLLMFDSLNRRMLPPYGGDWVHAPNFQRLARRTVTFDNCYIGSMPCMPARREFHTGRYNFMHRSWGPLETWAFVTWLTLAFALHARLAYTQRPHHGALLIIAVFVLAFLTFFGVPFISTAPHKGAV